MSLFKEVRALHLVPSELVKPMKSNMPVRLAFSTLELLETLLQQLGTNDSGFTIDSIMQVQTGLTLF